MSIYEIYLINMLKPKYNAALLYEGISYLNLPYELTQYNEDINDKYDLSKLEKENIKKLLIVYEDNGKSKFNSNYEDKLEIKQNNVLSNRWCNENPEKYYKVIKNSSSFFR